MDDLKLNPFLTIRQGGKAELMNQVLKYHMSQESEKLREAAITAAIYGNSTIITGTVNELPATRMDIIPHDELLSEQNHQGGFGFSSSIGDHLLIGLDHGLHDTTNIGVYKAGSNGKILIVDEFWENKKMRQEPVDIMAWWDDHIGEHPTQDYKFEIKHSASDLKSPFDKYGQYERTDPMPRNVDRKKILAKRAKNKANKKRARHG